MAIFLGVLLSILSINASTSETDSWTYRNIELADSGSVLNSIYNDYLSEIIFSTNSEIRAMKQNNTELSDSYVEYLLVLNYYHFFFKDDAVKGVFSRFEICIDTGTCEGEWQKIERIALMPEESVFYQSDYSYFTKKYLASQIVACNVRFSTDKLTHMFKDGFNFFNYSRHKADFGIDDVESLSKLQEKYAMGGTTTGVISYADVAANLAGFRLLQDLFFKRIRRSISTGELSVESIDLCPYITHYFDETILTNEFVNPIKKQRALKLAIKQAMESAAPESQDIHIILTRKFIFITPDFSEKIRVVFHAFIQSFFSWNYRTALEIYYNNRPIEKHRKSFIFTKIK